PDFDLLEWAHARGLVMLQLTYNSRNFVGSGCMERVDDGLSTFGARFVRRLNDLGVIVDISHCGTSTTLAACRRSGKPVVASHTAARALHDHPRAKSDEELRAIAATGGVVGVCAVPFFLGDTATSIEDMLDHIDDVAEVV